VNEQRVRELGIRGLLEKPADIDEMEKAIIRVLGRECPNAEKA
jgi:hypothetical protein